MFNPFHDYFYYTKSERNGSIGLILISLFFFTLPSFYSFIFPIDKDEYISYNKELPDLTHIFKEEKKSVDTSNISSKIKLFPFNPNTATKADFSKLGLPDNASQAILNYRNAGGKFYRAEDLKKIYTLSAEDYFRLESYVSITPKEKRIPTAVDTNGLETPKEYVATSIKLFPFDPNKVDANTFLKLGFSQDVANNILRYRAKGGKFYSAKSLQKIYGLSQRQYERIAPFVEIEPIAYNNTPNTEKKIKNNPSAIIDINQATVEDWQQLYGIGEYSAKKIVNFRDYLGGFSSINQVGETYGIRPETFEKIKSQLQLSPILKKLNINTATPEELKKHPYLNWSQAQTICNYRKQHGNFLAAEELVNTKIVTIEESKKLAPYLDFSLTEN